MMIARKIYIGTSGWMYKHWGEKFYPKDFKGNQLAYYGQRFETVEINSSFYHLPTKKSFLGWCENSPGNFVFSVKMNQYITHRKRLILDERSRPFIKLFLENSQELRKKLSAILIQLPPSSRANSERLGSFLDFYSEQIKKLRYKPSTAIEFRHDSWFDEKIYQILRKHKIALVISSSPNFPSKIILTADFCYIRFHGSEKLFSSRYLEKELDIWKNQIEFFPKQIKKIYIYFNNDYSAYAIENALYLKSILK